jgi:hypothetical protein
LKRTEFRSRYNLPVAVFLFTRKPEKKTIARFVPVGKGKKGDLVEVMWYSHRDKWDHIGDFGGVTMPLHEAMAYVVNDASGCFDIGFPRMNRKRI